MTDLYDQRIDAMKARECRLDLSRSAYSIIETANLLWWDRLGQEGARNAERLAAYKRKTKNNSL